jgi:acetyl-CoA/propionyl-CoA carboxylase carboxyl transferase subunit
MLAAMGQVHSTQVVAVSTDATIQGGAVGSAGADVLLAAYDQALVSDVPVIGLWQCGGARLQEGVESLQAWGRVFATMTAASGRVPQISVVVGSAAGGGAFGPALTDVVVQAPEGRIFVTGPDVVRSVTGEHVDAAQLGGPEVHERSGVAHVVARSTEAAYDAARHIGSLLGHQHAFASGTEVDLGGLLPESARRAYDVHPIVEGLLDPGSGIELHAKWARNIVTTLGRLGGRAVGIVANNPLRLGGCLDGASAEKGARFVRMCDSLGVPIVVVVDVPGYLPGVRQESGGGVRRGAKLVHAFAGASVPRVTLITRKAYGGAYVAMNSSALGATKVFAWPSAEIGIMGPLAAVRVLHRRRLEATSARERAQLEHGLAAEHQLATGGLSRALALGAVDEIIEPWATRGAIIRAIREAPRTRGRHGNVPL